MPPILTSRLSPPIWLTARVYRSVTCVSRPSQNVRAEKNKLPAAPTASRNVTSTERTSFIADSRSAEVSPDEGWRVSSTGNAHSATNPMTRAATRQQTIWTACDSGTRRWGLSAIGDIYSPPDGRRQRDAGYRPAHLGSAVRQADTGTSASTGAR